MAAAASSSTSSGSSSPSRWTVSVPPCSAIIRVRWPTDSSPTSALASRWTASGRRWVASSECSIVAQCGRPSRSVAQATASGRRRISRRSARADQLTAAAAGRAGAPTTLARGATSPRTTALAPICAAGADPDPAQHLGPGPDLNVVLDRRPDDVAVAQADGDEGSDRDPAADLGQTVDHDLAMEDVDAGLDHDRVADRDLAEDDREPVHEPGEQRAPPTTAAAPWRGRGPGRGRHRSARRASAPAPARRRASETRGARRGEAPSPGRRRAPLPAAVGDGRAGRASTSGG